MTYGWNTTKTANGFAYTVVSHGYQIPTVVLASGECSTRAKATLLAKRICLKYRRAAKLVPTRPGYEVFATGARVEAADDVGVVLSPESITTPPMNVPCVAVAWQSGVRTWAAIDDLSEV